MTAETQKINDCIKDYEALQARHLHTMVSDDFPDVEQMSSERKEVFDILKASLETYISGPISNQSSEKDKLRTLSEYQDKVSDIMILDEKLAVEIKKHKARLKDQLNNMKKGKMAINGYKNIHNSDQRPRVLSMNR